MTLNFTTTTSTMVSFIVIDKEVIDSKIWFNILIKDLKSLDHELFYNIINEKLKELIDDSLLSPSLFQEYWTVEEYKIMMDNLQKNFFYVLNIDLSQHVIKVAISYITACI
jgi:hypothetical protein